MPSYFGMPREAEGFREMPTTATPVMSACHYCADPINPDDDGVVDDHRQVWHADCWLLRVLRKLSPDVGVPEVGRQTLREAATAAVQEFERDGRL